MQDLLRDDRPRFREAVRAAMIEEMERDERVYLVGEEVGHYQGRLQGDRGDARQVRSKRGDRRAHHRERVHRASRSARRWSGSGRSSST